jgi:hypothetical protein
LIPIEFSEVHFKDFCSELIVRRIELFLSVYKREGILGSNKQLKEVEKEIEDGQYVVKPLYVTKFPFPGDEM